MYFLYGVLNINHTLSVNLFVFKHFFGNSMCTKYRIQTVLWNDQYHKPRLYDRMFALFEIYVTFSTGNLRSRLQTGRFACIAKISSGES